MLEQALNVCKSTVVREAWKRAQDLTVHGWIYDLKDGIIRDWASPWAARGRCRTGLQGEGPDSNGTKLSRLFDKQRASRKDAKPQGKS